MEDVLELVSERGQDGWTEVLENAGGNEWLGLV